MTNKVKKNKFSKISYGFSIGSLFIFAIPFGIVAFVLAIIALTKDESQGVIALVMSIFFPIISFIVSLIFIGMLL